MQQLRRFSVTLHLPLHPLCCPSSPLSGGGCLGMPPSGAGCGPVPTPFSTFRNMTSPRTLQTRPVRHTALQAKRRLAGCTLASSRRSGQSAQDLSTHGPRCTGPAETSDVTAACASPCPSPHGHSPSSSVHPFHCPINEHLLCARCWRCGSEPNRESPSPGAELQSTETKYLITV